jgi:fucose permease
LRRADAPALLGPASFAALGLADGLLGPAWPSIRESLDQPVGALAELQAFASAGFLCSALAAARLRTRLGAGGHLALGAAAGAVALAAFAASPAWVWAVACMLVAGTAAAAVDVGYNAHAALHFTQRLTNGIHAAYGLGTTIGPLVLAAAVAAGSWRSAYGVPVALFAVTAAGLWTVRRSFPTEPPDRRRKAPVPPGRLVLVGLMLAAFFAITGLEAAVGAWAPTVLVDSRGYAKSAAAAWAAAFWGGFTGARVALTAAGARLSPERVLRGGTALALAGLIVFWTDPAGFGTIGLPLAGAGLAGIFPALVLLTPLRLGADRATAAVGRQLAAGTIGVGALVGVAGVVAQLAGPGAVPPYLVAVAAALVMLELAVARVASARR